MISKLLDILTVDFNSVYECDSLFTCSLHNFLYFISLFKPVNKFFIFFYIEFHDLFQAAIPSLNRIVPSPVFFSSKKGAECSVNSKHTLECSIIQLIHLAEGETSVPVDITNMETLCDTLTLRFDENIIKLKLYSKTKLYLLIQ